VKDGLRVLQRRREEGRGENPEWGDYKKKPDGQQLAGDQDKLKLGFGRKRAAYKS